MGLEAADRNVAHDRLGQKQAFGQAVFRNIANSAGSCRNRITQRDGISVEYNFTLIGIGQTEQGFGKGCAAAAEQAGDAQHFACLQIEIDIAEGIFLAKSGHFHQSRRAGVNRGGRHFSNVAARHMPGQGGGIKLVCRAFGDFFAIAQDKYSFADFQHFGQLVADEDNGDAIVLQAADDLQKRAHLTFGQCRCRLIHDDQAGVGGESTADADQLFMGYGQIFHPCIERNINADTLQHFFRQFTRFGALEKPAMAAELGRKCDIFGDRQIGEQREILENHHHARCRRDARVQIHSALAVDINFTGGRLFDTSEYFNEGGLPRAVFTGKANSLARTDCEIHIIQSCDARIAFCDAVHLDEGVRRCFGHKQSSGHEKGLGGG